MCKNNSNILIIDIYFLAFKLSGIIQVDKILILQLRVVWVTSASTERFLIFVVRINKGGISLMITL